ncbi:MAG: V-type ATP synthase subunit F [Candidatus Bathyarchaeota archaeon]
MKKIALVADVETASFFKASGLKLAYGVKDGKEAEKIIWDLAKNPDVVILMVTEAIADQVKPVLDEVSRKIYPTVIVIPGKEGPIVGRESPILSLVRKTIGVEIKI